jgi:predicted protein tyrosine phosphatase
MDQLVNFAKRSMWNQWRLISIYGQDNGELIKNGVKEILSGLGCEKFLSVHFADITSDLYPRIVKRYPDIVLFNKEHARLIIEFIEEAHNDKDPLTMVVHCHAGISRSGAVGTFACHLAGLNIKGFSYYNSNILPNPYVLEVLNEVKPLVCLTCKGLGVIDHSDCPKCNGSGRL